MPMFRMKAAMVFIAAALESAALHAQERQARLLARVSPQLAHTVRGEPSSGAFNYRGGPGNRRVQRVALKKRNQARHRRACR